MKFATAVVQSTNVDGKDWNDYRARRMSEGAFSDRTAGLSVQNYSPDRYLLTHCTIISSVDTEVPPGVKTGTVQEGGRDVNRKFADYWVTPETSRYINANQDAWERKLLLATYRTFIGAENYCEHIQVPELSKGKIIDAVARDLGDTVYVDILVATDKKHKDLVARIESGEMSTLSMGCSISFSQCTKCGNVATDDTNLCDHLKYEKGNKFIREDGKQGIVAELCGHASDPSSVTFIEASWVENPAFKGAVMRNILNMGEGENKKIEEMMTVAQREAQARANQDWTQFFAKVAKETVRAEMSKIAFPFEDAEESPKETPEETPEETSKSVVDDLTDQLKKQVKQELAEELRREISKKERVDMNEAERSTNDNIIHAFESFAKIYGPELKSKVQMMRVFCAMQALSSNKKRAKYARMLNNQELVTAMYLYDRDGLKKVMAPDIYRVLKKVGSASKYPDAYMFLAECMLQAGRSFSPEETVALIRRAKLLN